MKLEDVMTVLADKPDFQLDVAEFASNLLLATEVATVSGCCCCCCLL